MAVTRCMAIALVAVTAALPACAQRGGGRGGFSAPGGMGFAGHSVAAFSGSRAAGSPQPGAAGFRNFTPVNHYTYPGGPLAGRPSFVAAPSAPQARPGFSGANTASSLRRGYTGRDGRFRIYPGYGFPVYGFPGYGLSYLSFDGLEDPDLYDYYDQGAGAPPPTEAYPGDESQYMGPPEGIAQGYISPPPPEQPQPYPAQQPYPAVRAQAPPVPALQPEEAVTLIFKDGRAPEQIHNYALTRTTLYVTDGRPRQIPVSQLDLAATEKVNREAGVEFQLPQAAK